MGALGVLLFVFSFMAYVGSRCAWLYYKHGFAPPGDESIYRNSAWLFIVLGSFGTGATLCGLAGVF